MKLDIKVPGVGESVMEALLSQWFKKDGEYVAKDDPLFAIETDKVTLEVEAEIGGVLSILVNEGETVAIGAIIGTIDSAGTEKKASSAEKPPLTDPPSPLPEQKHEPAKEPPSPQQPAPPLYPPSVRRLARERQVDLERIKGTGPHGQVTKGDLLLYLEAEGDPQDKTPHSPSPQATRERIPMTPIRKRIASRLLYAKQNTAMLTTFNEIDMGRLMDLRKAYKASFQEAHDVGLGMMSFFTKACVTALQAFPEINASIEGEDIVYHRYYHIGVAIGSKRGLVVPVIRHADQLSFAAIEKRILAFVAQIKANKLALADLEGGTFTLSNGGVYGSLLSTPILNTPQSGILGMHKIEKRPVVIDDAIVIRPMMYVALSYDHRIVDGQGAVTFLKRIKELIENPERMMLEI